MYTNPVTHEMNLKVVYIGNDGRGATDALYALYAQTAGEHFAQLKADEIERGHVSHFVLQLGEIRGFKTRFHLYAFDGDSNEETDRLLLKGADVVVYTASSNERDSDVEKRLGDVQRVLDGYGYKPKHAPLVFQYRSTGWQNKRPSRALVRAAGIDADAVFLVRASFEREDALSGKQPKEAAGLTEAFEFAAKRALLAARDAEPIDPRPDPNQRWASVGEYRLLMPSFWADFEIEEEPPRRKLVSIPTGNMTFDVLVIEGVGSAKEVERYLSQVVPQFQADKAESSAVKLAGLPFRTTKLIRPRACSDDDGAVVNLYAGVVGHDLFAFEIGQLVRHETLLKLHDLCLQMIEAALIRRMNEAPQIFEETNASTQ